MPAYRPGICCCCTGFRFHLLAGLTDFLEVALLVPQLIVELAAQVSLAVALADLGIQDLGAAHQGIDLLLQLLRRSQGLGIVLGRIGLNLGAIQRHMAQAHHAGLLGQSQDLDKQTLEGVEVAAGGETR